MNRLQNSDWKNVIGKSIDALPLKVRWTLTGRWMAVELYSPERLPLRILAAVGDDARDCVAQLRANGVDPALYHFELITEPYSS